MSLLRLGKNGEKKWSAETAVRLGQKAIPAVLGEEAVALLPAAGSLQALPYMCLCRGILLQGPIVC